MVAVVATFSGPADSLYNAAAAFAHAGAVKVASQTPGNGLLVLEGKAESAEAIQGALAAIAGMPGIQATASTRELPAEEQTAEEAEAAIAAAEASVAAFTAPSAVPGAGAPPDLVVPPAEAVAEVEPAPVESSAPATPIIPDLGATEPFVVRLTGGAPAELVAQGESVCQALVGSEACIFAEPPTGWDEGAWCIYGDTTLDKAVLYSLATGAAPAVTVSTLHGRDNIRADAEARAAAKEPAAPADAAHAEKKKGKGK